MLHVLLRIPGMVEYMDHKIDQVADVDPLDVDWMYMVTQPVVCPVDFSDLLLSGKVDMMFSGLEHVPFLQVGWCPDCFQEYLVATNDTWPD